MNAYTACILGPYGSAIYLHVMADDIGHARELVLGEARQTFGRREFTYSVRKAS